MTDEYEYDKIIRELATRLYTVTYYTHSAFSVEIFYHNSGCAYEHKLNFTYNYDAYGTLQKQSIMYLNDVLCSLVIDSYVKRMQNNYE